MTWSLAQGEVEKHQNLLVAHPRPGACSLQLVPLQVPADSVPSAVLLLTLGGFGYKFIFIKKKKKKELKYSVLLFLSPLQRVSILGNGAKAAAAIYSRGRCVDPGARGLGWAWGCLTEGGKDAPCNQR